KFLLKPNFTTDGWDYNEDGSLGEEVSGINLTEENIYYDEPNNKLFTYNTVSGSLEKKAIKQEEHKFFKNLLHIYGEYDLENVLQEDKYVTVPKITSIDGITFNSDGLSLLDRILQVEEINVRSLYNKALEPTFYSSYCNIKGIIQGIYVSGYVENSEVTELNPASGYLSIGYEDREEPVLTSNRLKFSTELQKILPVRTINGVPEQFKESEIHYENAKWLDTNEKIYSPEVKDFTVTRNISNTDTEKLFSYYKNTLVLEGEIDLVTPNYISFAKNSKLQDALSYLRINDTIKDIYAITTPSTEQFIEISSSELNSIKFIDYQQDKFIMANETGYVFTNQYKTIQAIPEGKLNLEPFYPLSGEAAYSYNNLTSLSYDKPNNRWLVALTGQNLDKNYSDIIAIKLDKLDGESRENVVFQNPGIDVNTYDFIKILESFDYRTPQELSKLTSEQLQNYQSIFDNTTSGYVLARDLSIIEAEELEENIIYFSGLVNDNVIKDKFDKIDGTISGCSESDDSKIEALQYFLTSEGNEQKEKDVLSITKDSVDGDSNGIWKSNKIVLNQPSDYKILSLNVSKIKTTNSKATISIGFFENIGQMWIYDKFTEKWTVTTSILSNHDFLVHSNGSDVVHCECYICGWFYNIDEENQLDWGLNIHSLPRAEVSDDTIVCAFILDPIGFNNNLNFTRLKIKIEKNSKEQKKETFMISDIVLKDKKNIPYNSKILEGVYSPTVSNSFIQNRIKKHVGNKWVLNNNNEYQAIVIGSTLFLYSPTNLYDILTKKKSGVSKFFHWKRAELPSVENITYSLFNEMNKKINYLSDGEIRTGLFELWSLVNENYENIVNLNKSNLNSSIIFTSFKTWLLNNKPIFYKTEEEIPLVITHEGLEIIQTEKGKIINLGEKLLHQWNAPQDILVEMGISSLVYLKKQNYIRYLADYYAIILGCKKFKNFFDAGNIKDAKLTENYLYFQTHNDDIITLDLDFTNSREDIENYNNWNFSNIDEHYVINLQADNLYLEKTIGLNGVYETLELIPYLESKKGFTICEKYINKNIHIYVGYILANNFIQNKNLSLMYEYYPNDTKNILLIKYPVIFVSTDNGVNFKRQDLFSGTNKIPKINSYDSSTIESSSNLWFSQIFKVNNELRINLQSQLYSKNEINNNPIENLGYTSYLISEYENDVSILYQNNFEEYSNINEKNDKRLKITRNSKIKNIEVYYTTNNTINVTENSTIGSSVFLKRPFSFNTNNTFISLLDDDGLEFSPSLENKSDDHEQIRVLVSIVPYEMLERPTQYVSYLPEYLNGYGDFAVSSFIEVDNITQANRLYSKRECMTPEVERLVIPKNGIPAIAEDLETGRHVYQYYDPYVNAQGETTYKYIEAKNSAGQIVKLCRLNGDYLTELDSISNTNYFNLRTMITENVEYASLIAAPLLLPDYEATTLNSYFTDILQSIVNKKYIKNTFRGGLDKKVLIQYINFMGVAPQLYLDLFKITNNDIIEYLLEHDETIFG
ncbi:MAG: hypothetical protein LBV58_04500, partial [Acholeplasmatales bacterium]|nr:hypothetical protein [Acholeplasmatales bacterium]